MNGSLPTILFRHRRENKHKCSLRGLETHPSLRFFIYPRDPWPDLSSYILLSMNAPLLSQEDAHHGLLLLDGTWRRAASMEENCPAIERRSLPSDLRTAYPRRQTDCPDPELGLATVEALYIAHCLLHRSLEGLLDHYYWKDEFLRLNASRITMHTNPTVLTQEKGR